METTIDGAGRLVIPKRLRDRLGIRAGTRVQLEEDGNGLRMDVVTGGSLVEVDGVMLIDGSTPIDDDTIRELRLGLQR